MVPDLEKSFGLTTVGVGALLGTFYYTYSLASLVAGASLDRFGAKIALPLGLLCFGIGCVLFRVPETMAGYAGRLLQGGGFRIRVHGCCVLSLTRYSGEMAWNRDWLDTMFGYGWSICWAIRNRSVATAWFCDGNQYGCCSVFVVS